MLVPFHIDIYSITTPSTPVSLLSPSLNEVAHTSGVLPICQNKPEVKSDRTCFQSRGVLCTADIACVRRPTIRSHECLPFFRAPFCLRTASATNSRSVLGRRPMFHTYSRFLAIHRRGYIHGSTSTRRRELGRFLGNLYFQRAFTSWFPRYPSCVSMQ